jgi:hypothetical protein
MFLVATKLPASVPVSIRFCTNGKRFCSHASPGMNHLFPKPYLHGPKPVKVVINNDGGMDGKRC